MGVQGLGKIGGGSRGSKSDEKGSKSDKKGVEKGSEKGSENVEKREK